MRWTADLAFCWNGVSTSIKFSLFSFPSWLLNLPDRAALWEYDGFGILLSWNTNGLFDAIVSIDAFSENLALPG